MKIRDLFGSFFDLQETRKILVYAAFLTMVACVPVKRTASGNWNCYENSGFFHGPLQVQLTREPATVNVVGGETFTAYYSDRGHAIGWFYQQGSGEYAFFVRPLEGRGGFFDCNQDDNRCAPTYTYKDEAMLCYPVE